jgi:periplasmic protein TonB
MSRMGLLAVGKVIPLRRRARHIKHAPWSGAVGELDLRVTELERRIARLDRHIGSLTLRTRMRAALVMSILLHLLVIFGVGFKMPAPGALNNLQQPLEVVLVNTKTVAKPLKADALAQANLDGGGNTDADRRAKSPLPVARLEKPAADLNVATQRVKELEREAKKLLTQAEIRTPPVAPAPPPDPQPVAQPVPAPNAMDLMQRSLEIARLEAQISRGWDSYQKRPRRRFVGARTQEFRFARYIEDWRIKIERIGELNYPQAARDQKLYGSLVVTVSIKADGSLERAEINRSSGTKILDDAALRIVKLGAPFSPFPADIARDTDILSITRTWTFTRSDQLVTE